MQVRSDLDTHQISAKAELKVQGLWTEDKQRWPAHHGLGKYGIPVNGIDQVHGFYMGSYAE